MLGTPAFLSFYHAGALFNLKELTGNAMLVEEIATLSKGRYRAILPQDLETAEVRTSSIRDADLEALLSCNVALFNFDGPELDSGTVVEFMVAKFADIPSVIVRSDFRRAGDNHTDPWNLMVCDYPRTKKVIIHAMESYQKARQPFQNALSAAREATQGMAEAIISAFDEVRQIPPVLPENLRPSVYEWIAHFAGGKMLSSLIK